MKFAFQKMFMLLMITFIGAVSAFAQDKVYIKDFSIAPGETKTVEICLSAADPMDAGAFGYTMVLPAGLSYEITTKNKTTVLIEDNFDFGGQGAKVQSDKVTFKAGYTDAEYAGGDMPIFTISLVAASDFAGGNIIIKDAYYGYDDIEGATVKVTAGSAGVDVKMVIDGASKYGTFVAPFDVTIPAGVKAYTATVNGEYAELAEITTTIPANTAVVVYSENAVNETFTGVAGSTPVTTGALTGVFAATEATVGTYVLQNQGGVVAFYVVNSVKPTIGANRCYLSASTGAKAIYFDEATAIAALQNASSIEGAYSASGVKNNGLKKGVNIVKMGDGSVQKIMVK